MSDSVRYRYCPICGRRGLAPPGICPHCVDLDTPLRIAADPDEPVKRPDGWPQFTLPGFGDRKAHPGQEDP